MRVRSALTRPWETITTTTKTNNGDIWLLLSRQLHCFTIAVKRTAIDPIWIMTGLDKTKCTALEWHDMSGDWCGQDKTYSLRMTRHEWWLVWTRQNVQPQNDTTWVVTGVDKTKRTASEWSDISGDWCGRHEWPSDWFGHDKTYSFTMTRHQRWLVWTRHHVRNKHSGRHWKSRTYP